jgi:DNA primase
MAPSSPADHALRMLLLNSEWLEKLAPDDHDLIHHLPAPHGELGAWLERQVAEHGPLPWAALEASLREQTPAETLQRLIPVWALEDELEFQDLRRALDTLWIEKLSLEQSQWAAAAAHDPQALKHYRALSLRLSDLKKSVHLGNTEKL